MVFAPRESASSIGWKKRKRGSNSNNNKNTAISSEYEDENDDDHQGYTSYDSDNGSDHSDGGDDFMIGPTLPSFLTHEKEQVDGKADSHGDPKHEETILCQEDGSCVDFFPGITLTSEVNKDNFHCVTVTFDDEGASYTTTSSSPTYGPSPRPLHEDDAIMSNDDSSSLITKIKTGVAIVGQAQLTVINGTVTIFGYILSSTPSSSSQSSGETVTSKKNENADTFQNAVIIDCPRWSSSLSILPHHESASDDTTIKGSTTFQLIATKPNIDTFEIKPTDENNTHDRAISISDKWCNTATNIIQSFRRLSCDENIIDSTFSTHHVEDNTHDSDDIKPTMVQKQPTTTSDSVTNTSQHTMDSDNVSTTSQLQDQDDTPTKIEKHRTVICGAKGVGKSTYLRYLVNRFLSHKEEEDYLNSIQPNSTYNNDDQPSLKQSHCQSTQDDDISVNDQVKEGRIRQVAILDCDVGQPELSCPCMLSITIVSKPMLCTPAAHMVCNGDGLNSIICNKEIHSDCQSPSFAIAKTHLKAYFYGYTTSKANPISYLAAIKGLVEEYEDKFVHDGVASIPLIVNTDGWVKSMGYEILSSIIDVVAPDNIVQILGTSKAKFFDLSTHSMIGRTIHVVEALGRDNQGEEDLTALPQVQRRNNPEISSSCLRTLRLCTYFLHGYTNYQRTGAFMQQNGIIMDEDHMIARTIAGMKPYIVPYSKVKCVFLDEVDSEISDSDHNFVYDSLNCAIVGLCTQEHHQRGQRIDVLESCLPCYGLGIVRAIDRPRGLLYILTPVPQYQLKNVDILVGGLIQVPFECMFRGKYSESFPYITSYEESSSKSTRSFGQSKAKSDDGAKMK